MIATHATGSPVITDAIREAVDAYNKALAGDTLLEDEPLLLQKAIAASLIAIAARLDWGVSTRVDQP